MCNRKLQLKVGLNTDTIPFNTEGDCVPSGIYYCDAKVVMTWRILDYTHLCTVEIPDDAQTVKFSKKYRSDKIIILDIPVPFEEHKMWSDIDRCKLVVTENGHSLVFVKEQTEEMCKLAVQQNGLTLKYVKHLTEEICKIAVQQNGDAFQYVKNQTDEICKLAVQKK